MSDSSSGGYGLGGRGLYIAIAAWLILVLAGGLCTWYGWLRPGRQTPAPESGSTAAPTTSSEGGEGDPTASPPPATADPSAADPTAVPGTPASGEGPEAPSPDDEAFGYGIAVSGVGGGDLGYWMGQVQSLGLGWVKQQMKWKDWEGTPGEMDWSGFDALIDEANRRGLKVMLSVVDAPEWSRSYTDQNTEGAPPDNLELVADFMGRLVDRYQGRIHAIEVWNEQNLDREWDTAGGVDAEQYVQMLRLSYEAIKSRDPDIIVISGALSPTGGRQTDPNDPDRVIWMDDFDYLDRMIESGALDYCDCVGAHHNGINMPPDVAWDDGYDDPTAQFRGPFDNPHHSWSFKSTLWGYHERIQAAGSDMPLCVTEFGWASAEGFDGHPPGFEFALDNTLEEQARWNVQAFQLMREWGFVRMAFLWNLNYSQLGWGPQDPNAPYALIDFDGAPRPAFEAIRKMEKP
ncbi:MAG: cellulase family glycosylhydrolase [Chloroflexota bacterium]|nr:cellulase family glycosylhydrolase [Chloroflexota bacterium]